jgi:hypothetical protein
MVVLATSSRINCSRFIVDAKLSRRTGPFLCPGTGPFETQLLVTTSEADCRRSPNKGGHRLSRPRRSAAPHRLGTSAFPSGCSARSSSGRQAMRNNAPGLVLCHETGSRAPARGAPQRGGSVYARKRESLQLNYPRRHTT